MGLHYTFTCPLPNGVHARPASALEAITRRFTSLITLVNARTGESANAKSVLGIAGLDIRFSDHCTITFDGADEREAAAAVTHFLDTELARCDDAVPAVQASEGDTRLPPLLQRARAQVLRGTCIVPGIGRGRVVRMGALTIPDVLVRERITDVEAEVAKVDTGLRALDEHYDEQLSAGGVGIAATVLGAHHAIARDPAFRDFLIATVRHKKCSAAGAIATTEAHFSAILAASESLLLRERGLDIKDVCGELFHMIYGGKRGDRTRLTTEAVCVADNLTPGDFLSLDRTLLKGLALAHAASTSHTIVLARSFGIPTLSGIVGLEDMTLDGREVVVDADLGVLVTSFPPAVRRYYELEDARLKGRRERLKRRARKPAATRDGRGVEIGANIATAAEASQAFAAGADGIGLFRTEMLFVNRDEAPTEEEQFEEYRQASVAASGKPVIIRTLDVGGDKPIAYLHLPKEDNPFLGYRAVRMYPEFHALARTQVRALVRASAFGCIRVMVPMISRIDEVSWMKQMIAEEQATCAKAGVAFDESMQLGAMVEVPSMVFGLDHFARELDFFSVGTNDLLQYFLAVDRGSTKIANLYDPMTPAFLRLLKKVVDDSHAAGRWVGVCGELGGDPRALPLLVGLGFDELSMAAPGIAGAKAEMRALTTSSCAALVDEALACATGSEVEKLLDTFDGRLPLPLVVPDLVVIDADCTTREEAIKTVVDQLYVTSRTDHPRVVEAAVWEREAKSSTAFGHGFAIPHCKSDAVKANSLAVLRLRHPVEWESLDGEPVSVLILIAIREAEKATTHMKVLAALSRKVMHDEFRERLANEPNTEALCRFLMESVGN